MKKKPKDRESSGWRNRKNRRKRQAYNKWFNDCNDEFMAAVDISTDTPYVNDYLDFIQEKMQIKPEEESIEFFQTPVITFSEYEASRIREEMQNNQEIILQKEEQKKAETWNTTEKTLTESIEDEVYQSQLFMQQSRQKAFEQKVLDMLDLFDVAGYTKESILELPDYLMTPLLVVPKMGKEEFAEIYVEAVKRMGVQMSEQELYEKADRIYDGKQVMSEQITEEQNEPVIIGAKAEDIPELPDCYEEFIKLPIREQAKLLCPDYSDSEHVFEHLKNYAESVHHRFDYFSEAYDTAMSIQKEAEKMYLEAEAALIVEELKRAGATKENFREIKAEAIAPAFEYLNADEERLYQVLWEVERQLGVKADYEEDMRIVESVGVKEVYDDRQRDKEKK